MFEFRATRSEVRASVAEVVRSFGKGERPVVLLWLVSHLRDDRGAIWLTDGSVEAALEEEELEFSGP